MPGLTKLAHRIDELVDEQDRLRKEVEELEAARESAEEERDAYHQLYLETLERCRKLERGLLGQKAERLPASEMQLSLAMLGVEAHA